MSANYVSSGLPDSDSDSEFGFDQTHGGVDGNDADLYGDLETNIFHRSDQPEYKSHKQLTDRVHDLESRLVAAYDEIEQLKLKLKETTRAYNTVLKNAASLYETAKLQITQKNQVVTQLQRKLQEFHSKTIKPSITSMKEINEIDTLTTQCLSSVPRFSFPELCQEALQNLRTNEDDSNVISKAKEGKTRTNEWNKRFRHENISYYFYSHHEKTVHQELITDIDYNDDIGSVVETFQDVLNGSATEVEVGTMPNSRVEVPVIATMSLVQNNPIPTSTASTHPSSVPVLENKRSNKSGTDPSELSSSPASDPQSQGVTLKPSTDHPQRASVPEKRRSLDRSRSKDDLPPRDRYHGREKPAERKSTGDGDSYRGTQGSRSRPSSSNESSDRSHSREIKLPPAPAPSSSSYSGRPLMDYQYESGRGTKGRSRDDTRRGDKSTRYGERDRSREKR